MVPSDSSPMNRLISFCQDLLRLLLGCLEMLPFLMVLKSTFQRLKFALKNSMMGHHGALAPKTCFRTA